MQSILVLFQSPAELFELRLTAMEQDTTFCSTRFEARVRIERFDEHLAHRTDFWIGCDDWDFFLSQLPQAATGEAVLLDLDQEWRLEILPRDAGRRLELEIDQYHYDTGHLRMLFTSALSDEQLDQLVRAFAAWPRWWANLPGWKNRAVVPVPRWRKPDRPP